MSNLSDFKMVTKAVAAAIFDVCPKTIDNYIRDGRIPAPISFGSRDYWHPDDFQMFLDTFRRSSQANDAATTSSAAPPEKASEEQPPTAKRPAQDDRVHDSNPAVRQMARQQAKLRALNSAG